MTRTRFVIRHTTSKHHPDFIGLRSGINKKELIKNTREIYLCVPVAFFGGLPRLRGTFALAAAPPATAVAAPPLEAAAVCALAEAFVLREFAVVVSQWSPCAPSIVVVRARFFESVRLSVHLRCCCCWRMLVASVVVVVVVVAAMCWWVRVEFSKAKSLRLAVELAGVSV